MGDDATTKMQRCPGPSAAEILAGDENPPPALLAPGDVGFLGNADLSTDAYTSVDFHRREVAAVWGRCWQVACREEEVPRAGDFIVYDIVDRSAIVVRGADGTLRAFVNSCPHRGTRICDGHGNAPRLRCPFHSLAWTLDGTLQHQPGAWDFSDRDAGTFGLIPIGIGTWGGFVFVNFDRSAPSLVDFLEDLPTHFERWPLERRYTAAHVSKRLECNWKIPIEAFIETFHVIGIHPQSLSFFGDANSQYDVWEGRRHISRMINLSGVASPHVAANSTPQAVADAAAAFGLCEPGPLAPGETPRRRIAANLRRHYRDRMGWDVSGLSDSEVIDVIQYSLFPNLIVFGGYGSPLAYRSRPCGDDPNASIFEVWLLLPYAEGTTPPAPAATRHLAADERFGEVAELSYYGPILDQDADMMPRVQAGLRSSHKRQVSLANYQEIRIRHMRQTLAAYLAEG